MKVDMKKYEEMKFKRCIVFSFFHFLDQNQWWWWWWLSLSVPPFVNPAHVECRSPSTIEYWIWPRSEPNYNSSQGSFVFQVPSLVIRIPLNEANGIWFSPPSIIFKSATCPLWMQRRYSETNMQWAMSNVLQMNRLDSSFIFKIPPQNFPSM